jgi:16S rRNA processing protein RimM
MAFSASAANLQRGRPVYLAGERRNVLRAREDREAWIVQLEGIGDRTAAERYRGELLETPDAEVLRDDDDSYFIHELIGLRVETTDGQALGELVDVMQPGANDVYVVRRPGGEEVMIPAIGEVIDEIDIRGRVMRITPLPGLLDETQ